MKPEKTKLGKLEMQLLARAQLRGTDLLTSGHAPSVLEFTPEQECTLLSRMASSGLIIRLKRGIYPVPSQISTDPGPICAPHWVTYMGAWR